MRKMSSTKTLLMSAFLLALGGCASAVEISSTTFHGPDHASRGSLLVLPIDKTQEDSLEFRAVSEYLTKKLNGKGYVQPEPGEQSKYAAFITYGIDNGRTKVSSVPLLGQTGGGSSYSSGTLSSYGKSAYFSGTTTTMPTFGLIGAMSESSTEYTRRVNIDIWRNGAPPVKVYEIRGLSSGHCGNVNAVLFSIIEGMFKNFPGENGKTRALEVTFKGKC